MAKLTPISIITPTNIFVTAARAPIEGESDADKLRVLLDHFLHNNLSPIDMRVVPKSASSKSFTLRLPKKVLNRLDQYCQRTLYTRQQAFQIAVCASLKDLGITHFVDSSKAEA